MRLLWLLLALIGGAALVLVLNHDRGTILGIENHDFASLAFYAAWGILAASAIIPRRGLWREAARNLVLWLAIFLVLASGYIYRFELQDMAFRLSAGLVPGSPYSSVSADGREQITLVRMGQGQFNARGEVNGIPMEFVVDTGASLVVLNHQDAEAAGFDMSALQYTVPVSTANGRTTAARVELDHLAIGSIERRGVTALVARDDMLETSLLGMNFLTSLYSFEVRGDRLILTD
jgi:aspartyl protease family protein